MSRSLFYPDLFINQMSRVAPWVKKTRKLQWNQAEYEPTVSSHHNPGKKRILGNRRMASRQRKAVNPLSASEAAPEILGPVLSSVVQEEYGGTGKSPVDGF